MEILGAGLTLFGGINFVITLISGLTMQKKVTNPDCPQDARDVAFNKKFFKILLAITGAVTLTGIGLLVL